MGLLINGGKLINLHSRELLIYPDGDLDKEPERWIRKGSCTRCGKCCEICAYFRYLVRRAEGYGGPPPGNMVEGQAVSSWKEAPVAAENWEGYWSWWQAGEPGEMRGCAAYLDEGICVHFGTENFLEICRKFPLLPGDLKHLPDCGFYFERLAGWE